MLTDKFIRDRFTWLGYLLLGYFAFTVSTLGPLMPFLSDELHLNYTQISLHFGAGAIGAMVMGLIGEWVLGWLGRRVAMWVGAFGMASGYLTLTLGRGPMITIGGLILAGVSGSLLLMSVQTGLVDRHGKWRAIALAEGNTGASLTAMLAPFLVGTFQRVGVGWRGALYFGAAALAFSALLFWKVPVPDSHRPPEKRKNDAPARLGDDGELVFDDESAPADESYEPPRRRLPGIFWVYCVVLSLGTAVEWSMGYWGAPFLQRVVKLADVDAATAMSLFYVAMFVGRLVGSRLTRTMLSTTLFVGACGIALVGVLLFWLGQITPLNILGLFVAGLGIANMYPQAMSLALGIVPRASNTAAARIGLISGFSMFLAPQVLGQVADRAGLQSAYGIVVLLVCLALGGALFANNRLARRAALAT
jgi:fucose permease